jgi:hypothetical protein
MIPNNPAEVLLTLDRELDHHVPLVLYGRAALCLGFEDTPPDFQATLDVDAIITLSQLPQLMEDFQFWDALDRTNDSLQSNDLYLTHLSVRTRCSSALTGNATSFRSHALKRDF